MRAPASTPKPTAFELAESAAAHEAMATYFDVLKKELEKLGEVTVLDALGNTSHVHYALIYGAAPGAVRFTFSVSLEAARKA